MADLYVAAAFSVSVLLISIIWYIKSSLVKSPPLPPGPRGLPIVGYMPFLIGKNLVNEFTDLVEKYGPIFKIYLGSKLYVVINSPSLVKEVFRDQDAVFAYVDTPIAALVASYGGNDVIFSEPNSQWRTMRKIFVQQMMSNKSLEASNVLRRDQVRKAIRQVHENIGKPVQIGDLAFRTELNLLMSMLWGGGTTAGEEKSQRFETEFCDVLHKLIDLIAGPNISDFFPFLEGLDIQGVAKQAKAYMNSLDMIFEAIIAQHKTMMFSGETIMCKEEGKKDFLQILLEIQKQQHQDMPISQKQIKALLQDVMAAGTDTTATTIEWVMAELMNNPEAMRKAQKELSDVVGPNNMFEELHIPKLKYLESVIKETLRLHPPGPLLFPRLASVTTTVGGYIIPKNTKVFVNMCSIQRDPNIWDNPMEFKPERFLDDNAKCDYKGNHFHYLPFGSGRRICAGIPLAERMMFSFIASLLRSFDWEIEHGETLDMSETFGIVLRKTTPLFGIPSPRLSDPNLYV